MIEIDHASAVPPYEQVRSQLATQIRSGRLPVGTRLPTVRQLAVDLGLAVNTIARAYRELETADLVETRGRAGTFVCAADAAHERAFAAARAYADVVAASGLSIDEAIAMLRSALAPGSATAR
ncbi:MAG: GntR family transcriptional regulator [Jatrophihabitans sp.]|uniref:GntR family transcriptional regulator n=1 Tax=Jatrophihabitans sp. TaxID=1932789 RepID=UPI003F7E13CD